MSEGLTLPISVLGAPSLDQANVALATMAGRTSEVTRSSEAMGKKSAEAFGRINAEAAKLVSQMENLRKEGGALAQSMTFRQAQALAKDLAGITGQVSSLKSALEGVKTSLTSTDAVLLKHAKAIERAKSAAEKEVVASRKAQQEAERAALAKTAETDAYDRAERALIRYRNELIGVSAAQRKETAELRAQIALRTRLAAARAQKALATPGTQTAIDQKTLAETELINQLTARRNRLLAEQSQVVRTLRAEIAALGGATHAFTLRSNLSAQATASMRAAIYGLGASFGIYTSATILAASATYAFFAALRGTVKTGIEFEAQITRIGALISTAGINSQEYAGQLEALSDTALNIAASTRFMATDVVNAMEQLGLAGFTVEQTIGGVQDVLNLAAIGALDFSQAADIATNVLMGFGMQIEDLGYVVDVTAKAVTESNLNVEQFGHSMSYAAPVAHSFGVSLEFTSAMMEVLANAGIKGSRAGTGVRRMLISLFTPTERGAKAMQQFGIAVNQVSEDMEGLEGLDRPVKNLFQGAEYGTEALIQKLKDFYLATAGATQNLELLRESVGVYALPAFTQLIASLDKGEKSLFALANGFDDVAGSADAALIKMQDNTKQILLLIKSAAEAAAIRIFNSEQSGLKELAEDVLYVARTISQSEETLKAFVDSAKNLAKGIYELLKLFLAFKAISFFKTALLATGVAIHGTASTIVSLITKLHEWRKAQIALTAAVAAGEAVAKRGMLATAGAALFSPMGLAITGVTAALGILVATFVDFKKIIGLVMGPMDAFTEAGKAQAAALEERYSALVQGGGLQELHKERQALEDQLSTVEKQTEKAKELEKQYNNITKAIQEGYQSLRDYSSTALYLKIQVKKDDLEQAERDLAKFIKDNERYRAFFAALGKDVSLIDKALADHTSTLQTHNAELANYQRLARILSTESIAAIREELKIGEASLLSNIAELRRQIAEANAVKATAGLSKEEYAAADASVVALTGSLENLKTQLQDMRDVGTAVLGDLPTSLDDLNKAFERTNKTYKDLLAEMVMGERELAENNLKKAQDRYAALGKEAEALKEKYLFLYDAARVFSDSLTIQQEAVAAYSAFNGQMVKLGEAAVEVRDRSSEVAKAHNEQADAVAKLNEALREYEELRSDDKGDVEVARQRAEAATRESEAADLHVAELRRQLAAVEALLPAQEAWSTKLAESERLQAELAEAVERANKLYGNAATKVDTYHDALERLRGVMKDVKDAENEYYRTKALSTMSEAERAQAELKRAETRLADVERRLADAQAFANAADANNVFGDPESRKLAEEAWAELKALYIEATAAQREFESAQKAANDGMEKGTKTADSEAEAYRKLLNDAYNLAQAERDLAQAQRDQIGQWSSLRRALMERSELYAKLMAQSANMSKALKEERISASAFTGRESPIGDARATTPFTNAAEREWVKNKEMRVSYLRKEAEALKINADLVEAIYNQETRLGKLMSTGESHWVRDMSRAGKVMKEIVGSFQMGRDEIRATGQDVSTYSGEVSAFIAHLQKIGAAGATSVREVAVAYHGGLGTLQRYLKEGDAWLAKHAPRTAHYADEVEKYFTRASGAAGKAAKDFEAIGAAEPSMKELRLAVAQTEKEMVRLVSTGEEVVDVTQEQVAAFEASLSAIKRRDLALREMAAAEAALPALLADVAYWDDLISQGRQLDIAQSRQYSEAMQAVQNQLGLVNEARQEALEQDLLAIQRGEQLTRTVGLEKEELEALSSQYGTLKSAQGAFRTGMDDLNQLYRAGYISLEEYNKQVALLKKRLAEVKGPVQSFYESLKWGAQELQESFVSVMESFRDSIVRSLEDGKWSFADFFATVKSLLYRFFADQAVRMFLSMFSGGAFSINLAGMFGAAAGAGGGSSGGVGGGTGGGGFSLGGVGSWFGGNSIGNAIANFGTWAAETWTNSFTLGLEQFTFGAASVPNWAFGAGGLLGGLAGGMLFGDSEYGAIGASIGASFGTAAGASLATYFAGAGSIFGPVGTIVGGLLGGIAGGFIGSLFGGDQKDPVAWIDLQGGVFKGTKAQGMSSEQQEAILKEIESANKMLDELGAMLGPAAQEVRKTFSRATGAQALSPDQISNWLKHNIREIAEYMINAATEDMFGGAAKQVLKARMGDMTGTPEEMLAQTQAAIEATRAVIAIAESILYAGGDRAEFFGLGEGTAWNEIEEIILAVDHYANVFAKEGETVAQTLQRLIQYSDALSIIYDIQGKELSELGDITKRVAVAEGLAEAAGGLDIFLGSLTVYTDKYYSEAEKSLRVFDSLRDNLLAKLGAEGVDIEDVPGSREEFRELIESIDVTTEAGQKQMAMWLKLAGNLDALYTLAEQAGISVGLLTDELFGMRASLLLLANQIDPFAETRNLDENKRQLEDALGEAGYSGDFDPAAIAEFLRLLAATEDAGGEASEELLRLAALFGAVFDQIKKVEQERASLTLRLADLEENDAEARRLRRNAELAATDESNRALLLRIYQLEDEARIAAELAEYQRKVKDMSIRLAEAMGDSAEALRLRREAELEATDDYLRNMLLMVWAFEEAAAQLKERRDIEIQLLEAQGKSTEALKLRRVEELKGISEVNRAQMLLVYAYQDAAAILAERRDIEIQLAEAQGDTTEALRLRRVEELKALSEAGREAMLLVYAYQDAAAILAERRDLEIRLAEAEGDSAEATKLRRLEEFKQVDESNQALLVRVWLLEDEAQALADAEEAMNKAYGRLEKAVDAEKAKINERYEAEMKEIEKLRTAAQTRIDGLNEEKAAIEELSNTWKSALDTVDAAIRQLKEELDPIDTVQRNAARFELLQMAASKDAPDLERLGILVDTIKTIDNNEFATRTAMEYEKARSIAVLQAFSDAAGASVKTTEERLAAIEIELGSIDSYLKSLDKRAEEAAKQRDAQLKVLDDLLAEAKKRLETALGIYEEAGSIDDAMADLDDAIQDYLDELADDPTEEEIADLLEEMLALMGEDNEELQDLAEEQLEALQALLDQIEEDNKDLENLAQQQLATLQDLYAIIEEDARELNKIAWDIYALLHEEFKGYLPEAPSEPPGINPPEEPEFPKVPKPIDPGVPGIPRPPIPEPVPPKDGAPPKFLPPLPEPGLPGAPPPRDPGYTPILPPDFGHTPDPRNPFDPGVPPIPIPEPSPSALRFLRLSPFDDEDPVELNETANQTAGVSYEELLEEVKGLRYDMVGLSVRQISWEEKSAKVLDKWDRDGLPLERD